MKTSKPKRPRSRRQALNPQQQRSFTRTKARATTPGTTGVGATAPPVGPRTNWAEVEAKAQQGIARSRSKPPRSGNAQAEQKVRDRMLKTKRGQMTGRTLAKPGLKARKSGHSGVARGRQTGTG